MAQNWVIVDASNKVVAQVYTPSASVHPKDAGFAWDAAQHRAFQAPQRELVTFDFSVASGRWSQNAAQAEKVAIAKIDAARDAQRRVFMTVGVIGQGYVYAEKRREVDAWRALGPLGAIATALNAAFAALDPAEQVWRFPFSMAEAALTGDSMITVIARYQVAITAYRQQLGQIDAYAVKAKRDVRATSTAATKGTIADTATTSMQAVT